MHPVPTANCLAIKALCTCPHSPSLLGSSRRVRGQKKRCDLKSCLTTPRVKRRQASSCLTLCLLLRYILKHTREHESEPPQLDTLPLGPGWDLPALHRLAQMPSPLRGLPSACLCGVLASPSTHMCWSGGLGCFIIRHAVGHRGWCASPSQHPGQQGPSG